MTYELHSNQSVVLGRKESNNPNYIRLKDSGVSRYHARITFDGKAVSVTDLGSTNGTILNRNRLAPSRPYRVSEGDILEIGHYHIVVMEVTAENRDNDQTKVMAVLPALEYEFLGQLGRGAMGRVWKARHKVLGRYVAVKALHEELVQEEEDRRRFVREARIAAGIDSPHIVKMYDARIIRGVVYLFMEFVNGPSLKELTQQGPLPVPRFLRIFLGVSLALQELLSAGIVHRDIKPANILVAEGDTAKLTDFGIARPFVSTATIDLPRGMGLGTIPFVAPEQALEAEDADELSDIFGLGATMYYVLAGVPPRIIRSYRDLETAFDRDPPLLTDIAKDCPKKLCDLVMSMLANDPKDRPPGPSVVIAVLDQLIRDCGSARPSQVTNDKKSQ